MAIGTLFLGFAVMKGLLGPVFTIINLVGPVQMILEFLILGIPMQLISTIGCGIVVFGVTLMLVFTSS
jgi:hypothetical protein